MLIWIVPLALLVIAIIVIVGISFRHYNEVAAVNPDTDPERLKRKRKQSMFAQRIERLGSERTQELGKNVVKAGRAGKNWVKRLYGKAQALERHYRRLQKETTNGVAGTREIRDDLLKEAEDLIGRKAFQAAEQRLIEFISLDAKNPDVYEMLGEVYEELRQYDQAKETFQYALGLAPEDASIHVHLGELAMRDGALEEAMDFFEKAVDIRPTNPKYLDFLIESSILAGDKIRALKGLDLLKNVNPENQKIEEFQARVREL